MKNKIKKIQIFRFVTQIAFLFLLPGLFTLTFGEIKKLYTMIIQGNFNFYVALAGSVEFLAVILLTILLGRFFCGWMCAFGTFNDVIHIISKKVFKINFIVDKEVDAVLKYVKYVILLMLIVVSWTMGSKIFQGTSPWDAFGQITNFPEVLYSYTFGVIILILIAVGAMFIERFFCRYLCPLGAVFTIMSKLSLFKIKKPNEKCGKCRLCTNNCSMGLPLYKVNNVRGGECINCFKCVETCPRKNVKATIANEEINPALASSIAVAAFVGVYSISNVGSSVIYKSGLASSISSSVSQNNYKDGTYTGTADGFRPGLEVSVTVKGGKITNIQVVKTNDTPGYFDQAQNTIPNEIIQSQSTAVDTVSGATFSSNGIINAVKDALKSATTASTTTSTTNNNTEVSSNNTTSNTDTSNNAGTNDSANTVSTANSKSTTSNSTSSSNTANSNTAANSKSTATTTTTSPSTTTSSPNVTTTSPSTATGSSSTTTNTQSTTTQTYKDGTYTGTANGFRPGLQVSVAVKSGKITDIQVIQSNDTPRFISQAINTVPDEIIKNQSTTVDTVSGATYSSNGIINATIAALEQAKA